MNAMALRGSSTPQINSLADAVASAASFGRLMAEGVDVDTLIWRETSIPVLGGADKKARNRGDLRWMVRVAKRLADVTGDPQHRLELARVLVWASDFEGADAALPPVMPTDQAMSDRAAIDCQIALGLRDIPRARKAIATRVRLGADPVPQRLAMISAQLAMGQTAKARKALTEEVETTGMSSALAALDVRLTLLETGPRAALARLDDLGDLLPSQSEPARAIRLNLLNERGRYSEALDLAMLWLRDAPLSGQLYPLAMHAAQHCDRVVQLGALLADHNTRYPGTPEIVDTLCNHAIDQGDTDLAATLLEEVRGRSSWTWMIMQFGVACQNPNENDCGAFLAMLEADGVCNAGPAVLYALLNYYFHADAPGLARAQVAIDKLIGSSMDDSGLVALNLRLLIALDRDSDARAFYESLPPGLAATAVLAPFKLYFLAQSGQHALATAGWQDYLTDCAHMALNARSSYPEDIAVKYDRMPDDILAFITVFDGIEYVEWFLDHYRKLGVAHFFFCDNGSTDGTFELLQRQPDVSLFRNTGSFSASACGVFWTNHLMRRFGVGHWCLHLDMDEALVFPGQDEGRSLRDLVEYFESRGFGTASGAMIDIYPDALDDTPATNAFVASRFIDTDYVWMRNELPPYHFVKGGVRARLTGRSLLMTKAPLVKMRADTAYIANNHQLSHLPVADVTLALLHYKFIGAFRDRISDAVERQEHFQGARFYRALNASVGQKGEVPALTSVVSTPYLSPKHLETLGLLTSSSSWKSHKNKL